MNGNEHRDVGDTAYGGALVSLGGDSSAERFWLSFGDVMGLSGDYFSPSAAEGGRDGSDADDGDLGAGTLFDLARIPGRNGTRLGSRDEIICALHVMTIDEAFIDERFERGGRFAGFVRSPRRSPSDVERRVRDRYLVLAATNDDHFVAAGGITHPRARGGEPYGSAVLAYRRLHEVALEHACRLGAQRRRPVACDGARGRRAALPDRCHHRGAHAHARGADQAILAGALSRVLAGAATPGGRRHGLDAARARLGATPLARGLRARRDAVGAAAPDEPVPAAVDGRLSGAAVHDWDNVHGLTIEGGGVVFGDGHVHQGMTREFALAASRAGIDDVEAAFELGAAGSPLTGEPLYDAVRAVTGAGRSFLAESRIPRVATSNPQQNWRATDVQTLWEMPIVGSSGTTVGEALTQMMHPDGYFIRQLDRLGQGLVEPHGLLAVPLLGQCLARKGAHAYHRGFVAPLAAQPPETILSVIRTDTSPAGRAGPEIKRSPCRPSYLV